MATPNDGDSYAQGRENPLTVRCTHVNVMSLGHSGSTILSIALGAAPGVMSVGEVSATVRRMDEPQRRCTCGETAEDCPLWSQILSDEKLRASKSFHHAYARLYAHALSKPELRVIVDSSKRLCTLYERPTNQEIAAKVLFLVRDPRGFTASYYRKQLLQRKRGRQGGQGAGQGHWLLVKDLFMAAFLWWYGNRRMLRAMRRLGMDYLVVSYERMVFEPENVEQELSSFLGVPISLRDFSSPERNLHILRGNALRHDPERSSRLVYDYSWFYDPWVRRMGPLLSPLLAWGVRNGLLGASARTGDVQNQDKRA